MDTRLSPPTGCTSLARGARRHAARSADHWPRGCARSVRGRQSAADGRRRLHADLPLRSCGRSQPHRLSLAPFSSHLPRSCSATENHTPVRRMQRRLAVLLIVTLAACGSGSHSTDQSLEPTGVFRVNPVRPVAELQPIALAATPPSESGEFRPAGLLELTGLDPTLKLHIRYRSAPNFPRPPPYSQP